MQRLVLYTLTKRIWPGRISIQNLHPKIYWVIQQHDTEVWQEQPWRGNRQLKRSGEKLYIKLWSYDTWEQCDGAALLVTTHTGDPVTFCTFGACRWNVYRWEALQTQACHCLSQGRRGEPGKGVIPSSAPASLAPSPATLIDTTAHTTLMEINI